MFRAVHGTVGRREHSRSGVKHAPYVKCVKMGTIASVLQWYCTKCNYLNPTESVHCLRCRTSRKTNGNVGSLLHHPILATSGNATSGPVSSSCVRMKDVNRYGMHCCTTAPHSIPDGRQQGRANLSRTFAHSVSPHSHQAFARSLYLFLCFLPSTTTNTNATMTITTTTTTTTTKHHHQTRTRPAESSCRTIACSA